MSHPIDYSTLDAGRIEVWAEALGTLLERTAVDLKSGGTGIEEEFKTFMRWNPFVSLDKLALDTVRDLVSQSVSAALSSIAARTAELQRLTKDLRAVAAGAAKSAAEIRLEAVTRVIDATTRSIEALRDLEKALQSEVHSEELLKKVRSLLKASQALRNEVEASR